MNTRANRHAVVLGGSLAGMLAARTEITVEMDRMIVVSRSRKAEWCPACAHRLQVLSSEDTALVAERLADVPELAETLSDLIDLIRSQPWSFCSH